MGEPAQITIGVTAIDEFFSSKTQRNVFLEAANLKINIFESYWKYTILHFEHYHCNHTLPNLWIFAITILNLPVLSVIVGSKIEKYLRFVYFFL
jgi:hypothetical protein